jgi:Ni/Co efflux regulator RcnB
MPPGHARQWVIGQRLPPTVIFYEVPPPLVVQLTVPPPGYRYVRVAADILMIAAGTGMVAAAIQDLAQH